MTHSMPTLIDPFYSNRLLSIKLSFIAPIVKFIHRVKGKLKFTLHTGIMSGINKDLGKTLLMIEGLNSHISKHEGEIIPEEVYSQFMQVMKKYRTYYHIMEKVEFFDLDTTKELANSILIELYDIEFKLKNNVFQDKESDGSDRILIDYASKISYNTALQMSN